MKNFLTPTNRDQIPEIEYEEEDKCHCDECELKREIAQLRSSLIFILASNQHYTAPYPNNYCPICGNNYMNFNYTIQQNICSDCNL